MAMVYGVQKDEIMNNLNTRKVYKLFKKEHATR